MLCLLWITPHICVHLCVQIVSALDLSTPAPPSAAATAAPRVATPAHGASHTTSTASSPGKVATAVGTASGDEPAACRAPPNPPGDETSAHDTAASLDHGGAPATHKGATAPPYCRATACRDRAEATSRHHVTPADTRLLLQLGEAGIEGEGACAYDSRTGSRALWHSVCKRQRF